MSPIDSKICFLLNSIGKFNNFATGHRSQPVHHSLNGLINPAILNNPEVIGMP